MNLFNQPQALSVLGGVDFVLMAVLAYVTVWAALERLQFFLLRRPAEQADLACLAIGWQQTRQIPSAGNRRLGWLESLLRQSDGNCKQLLSRCFGERSAVLRWQIYLPMAANIAVSLGLLGSVLALGKTAQSRDAAGIIGQGMHATIGGVTIAILAGLLYLATRSRTQLLADQIDRIIETLETILAGPADERPPAASALMPDGQISCEQACRSHRCDDMK